MRPTPAPAYPRLNIYLDERSLRTQIKIAAARHRVSVSSYCVEAIRERLATEGEGPAAPSSRGSRRAAARALNQLRKRIGPIGIPVTELIRAGRKR